MLAALLLSALVTWSGLDEAGRLAGRAASSGYLRGKVVLVAVNDYATPAPTVGPRLEEIWRSFKSKPFVLVGSHRGETNEAARAVMAAREITFPVYAAAVPEGMILPELNGYYYVLDATGKIVLKSRDLNKATERVVEAIAACTAPADAETFAELLDYELSCLPGRAYLRLREMRKRFPKAAAKYAADWKRLSDDPTVRRLAELEKAARLVKDHDARDRRARHLTAAKIDALRLKYDDLRKNDDPFVAQEAKNCLADLKWAAATLQK